MKEKVEIAALQMNVAWMEPARNLEKMLSWIEKIGEERAFFPIFADRRPDLYGPIVERF